MGKKVFTFQTGNIEHPLINKAVKPLPLPAKGNKT